MYTWSVIQQIVKSNFDRTTLESDFMEFIQKTQIHYKKYPYAYTKCTTCIPADINNHRDNLVLL